MTKKDIILYLFKIFLLVLFIYQAYACLHDYVYQEPVTKTQENTQGVAHLPIICISKKFRPNNLFNISLEDYKKGHWKADGLTEEDLFQNLSEKLEDLTMDVIEVEKFVDKGGQYENRFISLSNETDLKRNGIKSFELHYYYYLKTYCYEFSKKDFQLGIHRIWFNQKTDFYFWTLPPGRFFNIDRDTNRFKIEKDFAYKLYMRYVLTSKH